MSQNRKPSFLEKMSAELIEYQLDKIRRLDSLPRGGEIYKQQLEAKETLIQVDNDVDCSKVSEEDRYIGRWSHYRVPEKLEERLSLNARPQRPIPLERNYQPHYKSSSERTIPKLKQILHHLENPHIPPSLHKPITISCNKMKNHVGRQALVISNKQAIRPKSSRRLSETIYTAVNTPEGSRPPSNRSSLKTQNGSGYQKIKRQFGFNNQENNLVYEKQILSQLIKEKYAKATTGPSPLANMLNYFTMSTEKKKKTSCNRLGLDKLLS